jgi:hypothetical protein
MRLLYTLRSGSAAGNCGGDLRLFFTTQNTSGWKPSPAPGMWLLSVDTPDSGGLSGTRRSFRCYRPYSYVPEPYAATDGCE